MKAIWRNVELVASKKTVMVEGDHIISRLIHFNCA
jgi:hypothetical protein